ncbi:elongation factor 1-alpha (ef-1-alpha) [Trypanosoma rangeli]|uniref:Elongation factor 1-alpha (Ef-1-alpha) n=1 Tax=Trypanosoma rangeli TaxID=5698 RepID=A0A422MZF2_TRYRA|nr:elongation factor 1-alpha (ef-1-alpha) [Trypanosoma rangeli]RNE98567.1 elongation factor 1-alpha (ef-1-alpha) [Trypanosoma rangeli]|eukprot:RNE98567.1 elongation factor 1-alpha (ef-1-alpha) [Trypanosoma rangeli]
MDRGGGIYVDELRRRQRRRRLASKPLETRRRRLQYCRRHNEKDGRLLYCDYCDLFVCSGQRTWLQHLGGVRHMEAVEAYYSLLEARDPAWVNAVREDVSRAHVEEHVRQHQLVAGKGASVPMPAMTLGYVGQQGIVVGGTQPPGVTHARVDKSDSDSRGRSSAQRGSPSVRVGGLLVAAATPPVVKVDGKAMPLPQGCNQTMHRP